MWSLLVGLALAGAIPDIDSPLKTGAKADKDGALVIGIEDYLKIADVPYAQRDAQAFYDWAVYTRGVPSSRVRLFDKGVSREQILEAAGALGQEVGAGGTLWVYFAGHGAADPSTGERLLLGDDVRADPAAFASRGVQLAELKKAGLSGGGAVSLIIDACYSGMGRGGAELVTGKRFAVPAYAAAKAPMVTEWNAAGPDEMSGPLDAARHGAFTYFVLGAMRGWADGELDGQRDGKVTAEEADLYVQKALRTVQITSQKPSLVATDLKQSLVAAKGLEAAPKLDVADLGSKPPVAQPPSGAPAPTPEGLTNAEDRSAVQAVIREVVQGCYDQHAKGINHPVVAKQYVSFNVKAAKGKTGVKLGGLLISNGGDPSAEPPQDVQSAFFSMYTCMRQDILALKWTTTANAPFKDWVTVDVGGAPRVPDAAPAPSPREAAPISRPVPASSGPTPLPPGSIGPWLARLGDARFESDRTKLVTELAVQHRVSCADIAAVIALLPFDGEQEAAVRMLAPGVLDPGGKDVVKSAFKFRMTWDRVEPLFGR